MQSLMRCNTTKACNLICGYHCAEEKYANATAFSALSDVGRAHRCDERAAAAVAAAEAGESHALS